MHKTARNAWALGVLTVGFAFIGFGDTFTWTGGEGAWNEASNWLLGEGISDRVPGVDTTDDVVSLGDVDAIIRFPTTVDETTFIGEWTLSGVSPAADLGTPRTITLDTRGTSFYYTNAVVSGVHPIVKGYSYNKGWQSGANAMYLYKTHASDLGQNGGTLLAEDAVLQFVSTPTNTTLIQKQGSLTPVRRSLFLCGATGGGTTNWTELVVEDGDFNGGVRLRGYSRFIFKSSGLFTGEVLHLLPRNDSTGDNYGGGPAEFIMFAGTNSVASMPISVGAYGGADARFVLCGTAKMERTGSGTVNGNCTPNLLVASDSASNSAREQAKRGEAIFADSAVFHLVGRIADATKGAGNHYGDMLIAANTPNDDYSGTNAVGLVTIKDDASVLLDKGRVAIGTGGESRGYLTVEGRGVLKAVGTVTDVYAAENLGICLGGTDSKEAVLTIKDSALVETPRVAATTANTRADWFVRNALILEGGTLKTSKIEGSALDVIVGNGTICARAATTAEAPLLAANGVKSLTAEGAKTLTIDTQDHDTYVDYAFPEDLIIVKKGTGTLYVKSSSHAKTIVENGAIVMTEDGGVFGTEWEIGEDLEIPLPSVTASGEVLLMNFASEAAAQAYADAYAEHVVRTSGYTVGAVQVSSSGSVWQVKVTITVDAVGATKTWVGADGAKWLAAESWNPSGVPEADDTLTVSGAATIDLPRFGYANALTMGTDTLTLTGGKAELRIGTVSVTGDQSSKEYAVAADDAVTIASPAFKAENVGFKKTGAGSLTLDMSATPSLAFISSNATDAIRINEGELAVKGSGSSYDSSGHLVNTISCFYEGKGVSVGGADTPANASAALTLNNAGFGKPDTSGRNGGYGGSLTVGNFGVNSTGATATLTMINKAIFCAQYLTIGSQPLATDTTSILGVTNASICVAASQALGFGSVANDEQANSGLKVVARFGEGSVVKDTGGGNCDGALKFGCGLDVAFEDGAVVTFENQPGFKNDGTVDNHQKGWVRTFDRAFGDVSFTSGASLSFRGGLLANNYATADLSETRRFRLIFDGGTLKPLLVDATDTRKPLWECRTAVFYAPEYQGFWAGADGMLVDMSGCSRYTLAAPVRGEGELVKTGAGTLVMGTGLKPTTSFKNTDSMTDQDLADETKIAASGVVTVQNAGGVRVAEGTVELEAGATDTNSTFTVESGCTLDLADNTLALGALKGAGTVSGGTISLLALKPLAEGDEAVTLTDVLVKKAVVDFGGAADKDTTVRLVKLGSNVSGALAAGTTFRLKAVNTGDSGLKHAECTVDADGLVTAKATTSGFLMILR